MGLNQSLEAPPPKQGTAPDSAAWDGASVPSLRDYAQHPDQWLAFPPWKDEVDLKPYTLNPQPSTPVCKF